MLNGKSAILLALLAVGCSDGDPPVADGAPGDLTLLSDLPPALAEAGEAGGSSLVDFVVQGCAERTETACKGTVPLRLTFSAVLPGGSPKVSWDFGDRSGSQPGLLATHTYTDPGVYDVTLSVSATGGTVSEEKLSFVMAAAAEPGAACAGDSACASKTCACSPSGSSPTAGCPVPLDQGLCVQACKGAPCPVRTSGGLGFICVDLGSGGIAPTAPAWRAAICLPGCVKGDTCQRSGFACRLAPVFGGWTWACVPGSLGPVGSACRGAAGAPDGGRCLGGKCLDMGAGGYCSASCQAGTCPAGSICARFTGDPTSTACLAQCQAGGKGCDGDPALACQEPDLSGTLGFQILGATPAKGTTFCAPRRCKSDGQCGLGGTCKPEGDGFCTGN